MATKKKTPPTEEELNNPRTPEQFRLALRRKTRMYYDIQELRLQAQGRLTKKAPGASIELHPRDLAKLQGRLQDLEAAENNALLDLDEHLQEVPFYKQCILPKRKDQYKGLGPRMASVIVASFDIHREDTVSKMWAFAGLAPVPAVRCKECSVLVVPPTGKNVPDPEPQEETLEDREIAEELAKLEKEDEDIEVPKTYGPVIPHPGVKIFKHPKPAGCKCRFAGGMIDRQYTFDSGKQMRPVAGEKLKYNAWLRTKLCGVLAGVLLKIGSPYRRYYDNRKQYNIGRNWGTSDAHRHKDAMRYMIKMLLLDIWKEWRAFEGLPVRPSYAEEKLGHVTSMKSVSEVVQAPRPPETHDGRDAFRDSLVDAALKDELDGAGMQ